MSGESVWGADPFHAGLYMAYVYTTPEPVRYPRITPRDLSHSDGVGLPPGNKDDNLADPQGGDGGPDPQRSVEAGL